MKLATLFFSTAMAATALAASSIDMRLMTYNIRLKLNEADLEPGEELWPVRRPLMASQLKRETADRPETLICMQEVTFPQLQDLQTDLGSEWAYIGVGRDDGAQEGEASPIFYRPSVWNPEHYRTVWLSPKPTQIGSKGWDAALPRIVTVVRFRHISSGAGFVYMCTHFDHKGQVAREKSAKFLIEMADMWAAHESDPLPVFLSGDLNVAPDNLACRILASGLNDVKDVVPKEKQSGPTITYTAFTEDESDDMVLDYIFARDPTGLHFEKFAVLDARAENGVFISDHRPVVLDFQLPVRH
ncbi:hypothetical protein FZEAL_3606 [Fusarium zealandicum]|uniref:Endonuclease/exonuclease/phosphatase domain-containing protein n=1 Tax=Fusarium zealandicum TaxID=1053134 RepID=A0A8H4UNX3_9HYPO|nr:hypothetical protein FZEAL_3606 [Fusarium zealandicum]